MSPDDRLQLFNALAALPPPAFSKLLFAISPPNGVVASSTAPQGDRAYQLLQWAESPTGSGLAFVQDVLNRLDSLPKQIQNIEALVATVRAQVHDDIQTRCGTMRVLDMEQPIGLGDIYTSVNILEKLSGRRRLGLDELLKDCDRENFDRFVLGQVRQKRVPGLEAVERYDQLMILGKPGAGKTTFLKRLAILCNQSEFQPQRVPMFVTLKDYAEAQGQPTLQAYIQHQWNACGVESAGVLPTVLANGQALVLLDGLDEVYETDHNRVLQDIKAFAHQFRNCQCVITCRIAAREYIFEQFTEVEVADFDQKQIAEFATKWFAAKHDHKKAKTFIQRLNDNKPIQELATNPLLLTLLCLVFGEAADFPANRAELYKEGLDVLLKKWDGKRNIERDQVYKKLSLKRKEDLLSQLACETFERGDYFFRQSTVESHIIHYIRNLPGANDDDGSLKLDSEAVLKSIEAQHGLLVERARGIYSFSHLTFQEYFTAQYITRPMATLSQSLQGLTSNITEKRYYEIFLLASEMLPEADTLLLLMKRKIDSITNSTELQVVLNLVYEKAMLVKTPHQSAAVRAFYFDLELDFALDVLNDAWELDGIDVREVDASNVGFYHVDEGKVLVDIEAFDLEVVFVEDFDADLDLALVLALVRDNALDLALDIATSYRPEAVKDLNLNSEIRTLRIESSRQGKQGTFGRWWSRYGRTWPKRLRAVMTEYCRSFGFIAWDSSDYNAQKLRQYYSANKLLIECLNSDCYVTKATRQYIEDTLLLPLSEIEKYPVPDAIANL